MFINKKKQQNTEIAKKEKRDNNQWFLIAVLLEQYRKIVPLFGVTALIIDLGAIIDDNQ
jgi:hypothetical protein